MAEVAAGLAVHGVETVQVTGAAGMTGTRRPEVDFVACWGWRQGSYLQALGYRVLVIELGYIGDRGEWTSLAWDGLNGRGNFCLPDAPMPERFAKHFEMAPWKKGGARVLITAQVPGDASLQGKNLEPWYREAIALARKEYGLPVDFRPHPRAIQRGLTRPGRADASGPLKDELDRSALVITWNSNSAVDAVLAGVPAVTMDPGAMAWGVTAHRVGDLVTPDRTEWANRVSWCQWSPAELASGIWWERMRGGL